MMKKNNRWTHDYSKKSFRSKDDAAKDLNKHASGG